MHKSWMRQSVIWVASALSAGIFPGRLEAQLVRSDSAPQAQSRRLLDGSPGANAADRQAPALTGGSAHWRSTLDRNRNHVQPGEHVVATATGKMHYADSPTDAGPEGLTRGFKDLIRILPYNAAGRGAVIGRVGDAATAQPFLSARTATSSPFPAACFRSASTR